MLDINIRTPADVSANANKINHNLHKKEEKKSKFLFIFTNKIKAFWLQIKF